MTTGGCVVLCAAVALLFQVGIARAASWSTPVVLSNPAFSQAKPSSIAVDGMGRAYVAISQRLKPYGHAYLARGAVVSSAGDVAGTGGLSPGTQSSTAPFVVANGVGNALFGWQRVATTTEPGGKVEMRQWNGASLLGPLLINSGVVDPSYELCGVGEAADSSGLILGHSIDQKSLSVQYISAAGAFGAQQTITTLPGDEVNAGLFEFPNGDALIAWGTGGSTIAGAVLYARYRWADGRLGPVRTLSQLPIGPSFRELKVTGNANGEGLVAWSTGDSSANNERVRARRFTPSNVGPMLALSGSQVNGRLIGAVLGDDGAGVVTWEQRSLQNPGEFYPKVKARWLFADGTVGATVSPAPAGSTTASYGIEPALVGSAGTWLVYECHTPHARFLQARLLARDDALGTAETVPSPTGEGFTPLAVAPMATGGVIVSFDDLGDQHGPGDTLVATVRSP